MSQTDLNQPVHLHNLMYLLSTYRHFASLAIQNLQADLNLPWVHILEGIFSDVAAQIFCIPYLPVWGWMGRDVCTQKEFSSSIRNKNVNMKQGLEDPNPYLHSWILWKHPAKLSVLGIIRKEQNRHTNILPINYKRII